MGLHLCSLRNLSSFYDSLNSSPGILTESDFSLSYSSPCQPKESDLSLACHFQNRSPATPYVCSPAMDGSVLIIARRECIVVFRLESVHHPILGVGAPSVLCGCPGA